MGSEVSRVTEINNFEKWKEGIVSSGKGGLTKVGCLGGERWLI